MDKICVYTCVTGNYDALHEVEVKEKGVDYLLFTNDKTLTSKTWQVIYIENEGLDNQRLSRKIKMLGHPIIDENYDVSVWMDASVIFQKSVKDFVNTFLKHNSFAAFLHHARDCIYDEAMICIKKKKDKKENILKQIAFLKEENYPAHYGLCEMTVFIKRHHDPIVRQTMQMWFDMLCRFSKRDQLSFMYCVYKTGLKIDYIPLNVWDNDWFKCVPHRPKQTLDTCRIYFGEDINFDPMLDLQPLYQKTDEDTYAIEATIAADTNCIEIEVTDVPCMAYRDLKIKGIKPTTTYYFNTITFQDKTIFYNASGLIKLVGEFKKGQRFSFQINLQSLTDNEKYQLIEYLSIKKIEADDRKKEFDKLVAETKKIGQELENIVNSKSWKLTKPLRKLTEKKQK